jgi:hypothetical protein
MQENNNDVDQCVSVVASLMLGSRSKLPIAIDNKSDRQSLTLGWSIFNAMTTYLTVIE